MYYSLLSTEPSFDNSTAVVKELRGTMTAPNAISIESDENLALLELPLYLEKAQTLTGRGEYFEVTDVMYSHITERWTLHITPYLKNSQPDVNAFIDAFGGNVVKTHKQAQFELPSFTPHYGIPVLNRNKRDYLKGTTDFGRYNSLWGRYRMGSTASVGSVMELITTKAPTSQSAWEEIYFLSEAGRSLDQLESLAMHWSRVSGLIPEHALAHVMIHVIDETYDGYMREEKIRQILNEQHAEWKGLMFRPDYTYDTQYAIDLAVRDAGSQYGFTIGIQVKPSSYFRSGDVKHRLSVLDKHRKARKLGIEVYTIDADKSIAQGRPVLYSLEQVEAIITGGSNGK